MLPAPTITTLNIAALDVGHRLGLNRQIPVGAAVLTARLTGRTVDFNLHSCVLKPSDPASTLLIWLDQHLTGESSTIAGYRLDDAAALLTRLPGAEWSPSLRALTGCGMQAILDLSARDAGGATLSFIEACTLSGILCADINRDTRFAAWCRSDTDRIDHDAQLDVIASFRLVLERVADLETIGPRIADALAARFTAWLGEATNAAARHHAGDLNLITG